MMAEFYRSRLLESCPECVHAVTTKDTGLAYEGSLALHTGESKEKIIFNLAHLV